MTTRSTTRNSSLRSDATRSAPPGVVSHRSATHRIEPHTTEGLDRRATAELDALYSKAGVLQPEAVVAAAADDESVLHPFFEWDDTVAAQAHRLNQARELIRRVRIVIDAPEEVTVRAYIHVDAADPRGYYRTEEVGGHDDWRSALVAEMQRDVTRLRRKYEHMTEFWETVKELTP